MADGCDEGGDGAEPRERETPRHSREASSSSARAPGQSTHRPVTIIYTYTPKPIHVEAQDFREVVQRLTGKHGSQANLVQDWQQRRARTSPPGSSRMSQEPSEGSTGPQQLSSVDSHQALENYLSMLDRENPPPQPSSNLGFFQTAGLVKGVDLELGLRWAHVPDSMDSSSSRPGSQSSSPDRGLK